MTVKSPSQEDKLQPSTDSNTNQEKVLCVHCHRTATNGIKCKGLCVADSDY
ncbi:hypothetical protein IM676_06175 [Anabaenopsis elenkinii CCIBt3563]|uniref:Uncharacterized protein n=1 Tax=Anabaenopsis elenkinii CCIBt3563 TaxID=2779889 RepID=A0A7S6U026_9CYAN|nr:hypothetical protein IM676_06175 [Anabaenopsis elenkinii CCIBt3563]